MSSEPSIILNEQDRLYLNALNQLFGAKINALRTIAQHFEGDFARAWHSDCIQIIAKENPEALEQKRKTINPEEEYEMLKRQKVDIVTIHDNNYPQLLRHISDPPFILYVRGRTDIWNTRLTAAVVGTRKATSYGKRATEQIVRELAHHQTPIFSGMALGIDSFAHQTAISEKIPTIAVLGCGIDDPTIYPQTNLRLAHAIIEQGGAVISEFPMRLKALRFMFPQRNRIISGTSNCTIVIEADIKSGSLITAKSALDQNRDVFAVPGPIFSPTSDGPNWLLKNGAIPITKPQDISEHYQLTSDTGFKKIIQPDNDQERAILAVVRSEPLSIDDIAAQCGLDLSITSSTLVVMDLKDKIKNIGNNTYVAIE